METKKLEFRKTFCAYEKLVAETAFGYYEVEQTVSGYFWNVKFNRIIVINDKDESNFITIEDAIMTAQKDFEERIKRCIK